MDTGIDKRKVYFTHSSWLPIYMFFCILGCFPVILTTSLVFQVSVASNIVLGLLAILGGPLGDLIFRRMFRKVMCLLPGISIQAIYLWPVVGLMIILLKPLE